MLFRLDDRVDDCAGIRSRMRFSVECTGRDADDGGADVDGLALGEVQRHDLAGERRGQLHQGFRRLDLDDDLIGLDDVSRLHGPRDDLSLGESFPDVGERELLDLCHVFLDVQ